MRLNSKHALVIVGLISAIGLQLSGAEHGWHDTLTPAFIGGLLIQIGTTLGALFVQPPRSGNHSK